MVASTIRLSNSVYQKIKPFRATRPAESSDRVVGWVHSSRVDSARGGGYGIDRHRCTWLGGHQPQHPLGVGERSGQ